jgi:hypothetical protein
MHSNDFGDRVSRLSIHKPHVPERIAHFVQNSWWTMKRRAGVSRLVLAAARLLNALLLAEVLLVLDVLATVGSLRQELIV